MSNKFKVGDVIEYINKFEDRTRVVHEVFDFSYKLETKNGYITRKLTKSYVEDNYKLKVKYISNNKLNRKLYPNAKIKKDKIVIKGIK